MSWFIPSGIKDDEKLGPEVNKILERWLGPDRSVAGRRGIRAQDHRCMELQQKARSSPVADDVRFSETWEAVCAIFKTGWWSDWTHHPA